MDWTKEMDAKLEVGLQNRQSARLIAQDIGVSRNAVLGRVFRLGLKLTGKPGPQGPRKIRTVLHRKHRPRVNPDHYIDDIMDLRDGGATWHEVAETVGLSIVKVREIAIAFGGYQPKQVNYFTEEEVEYIIRAWRDHVTVEDMADHLGRTFGVMRQKILQLNRDGRLAHIVRDPAKTRLLRQYGEQALAAGATPSEALANIAEAKRRALAEAINAARMAATKRHKIAIEKMLTDIASGGDRNQAIFDARAEGATLEEIAVEIDLTRERVRQICFAQAQLIALRNLVGEKDGGT